MVDDANNHNPINQPSPKRPKIAASPTGLEGNNAATTTNFLDLIHPLLQNITSYLPNADLMKVALVSRRMNTFIPRATTYENRAPGTITTVFHRRPCKTNKGFYKTGAGRKIGRLDQLMQQLQQFLGRDSIVLDGYQHVLIEDHHHKFQLHATEDPFEKLNELKREIGWNGPRIRGITSLDFCLSSARATIPCNTNPDLGQRYFITTLPWILPSLRELDLTNTCINGQFVHFFFYKFRRLEKITFNNKKPAVHTTAYVNIDGNSFEAANNLKELYMDDCTLVAPNRNNDVDAISDYVNYTVFVSDLFLFHRCSSSVLERVSIRNLKYSVSLRGEGTRGTAIPQNALMKYIRHCPPSLRWFCSNAFVTARITFCACFLVL